MVRGYCKKEIDGRKGRISVLKNNTNPLTEMEEDVLNAIEQIAQEREEWMSNTGASIAELDERLKDITNHQIRGTVGILIKKGKIFRTIEERNLPHGFDWISVYHIE